MFLKKKKNEIIHTLNYVNSYFSNIILTLTRSAALFELLVKFKKKNKDKNNMFKVNKEKQRPLFIISH